MHVSVGVLFVSIIVNIVQLVLVLQKRDWIQPPAPKVNPSTFVCVKCGHVVSWHTRCAVLMEDLGHYYTFDTEKAFCSSCKPDFDYVGADDVRYKKQFDFRGNFIYVKI